MRYKEIEDQLFTDQVLEHSHPQLKVLVPFRFLHGIQPKCEYTRAKERRVKHDLRTGGFNFLLEHPITLCLDSGAHSSTLSVLDGHHRARWSPKYNFRLIPAVIYEISAISQMMARSKKTHTENFQSAIDRGIGETISSFQGDSFHTIIPAKLPGNLSLTDLEHISRNPDNNFGILSLAWLNLLAS